MTRTRRVAVVTGSRADYGHLYWLLHDLAAARDVRLQLIVTGSHLARKFGHTLSAIRADGFRPVALVPMPLGDDSPTGISRSIAAGIVGFAGAIDKLKPDLLVVFGDRYEMLSATIAAMNARVPIAHIAGGETTEGAIDEAIRHSLSKMALYHFPGGSAQQARIIRMGEDPSRVFCFGKPGLDNLKRLNLLRRNEVEDILGVSLAGVVMVVTFHPVTLDGDANGAQFAALLRALDAFPEATVVFTRPNADSLNRAISAQIDRYVARHPRRAAVFASLGTRVYLSLLKASLVVVGNSSSGLIEAPALRVPTVNIGDRQRGRTRVQSVLDCAPKTASIAAAIGKALSPRFRRVLATMHPSYDSDGKISRRIARKLRTVSLDPENLKKSFYAPPARPRG